MVRPRPLLAAMVLVLLAACGQKGPLFIPGPDGKPLQPTAVTAASAPAAPAAVTAASAPSAPPAAPVPASTAPSRSAP
ncbi:MAG: lipoprotein [Burkholderiales bacterium]|nr:lipoprotein [Burkholderiales bacterium]